MAPTTTDGKREMAELSRPSNSSDAFSSLEDGPSSEEETLLQNDSLSERRRPSRSFVKSPRWCSTATWVAIPFSLAALLAALFAISTAASAKHCPPAPAPPTESFGNFPIKTDELGSYIECPDSSPAAALAAGCSFDVLLYGWLPPPCFDAAMYRDITRNGSADFGFYADCAGRQRIPTAELMKGDYESYPEAYVSVEEHWQHCTYMLNSSLRFRAREPPTALSLHLDQGHIGHCLKFLLERETQGERGLGVTQTKALFSAKRRCYLRQRAQFG